MKIAQVVTRVVKLPLKTGPWTDSVHHVTDIELVTVEVTTTTGVTGLGISHTSGVGAKSIASLVTDYLAPFVLGRDLSPRGLWHESWRYVHDEGGGGVTTMALGALDIAYYDAVGKTYSVPLTQLLGKCRDSVPVYGSGINLGKSLDELLEQVERWRAQGYRAVKVKVGRPSIEDDVERITKVRERIGHLPLMVDANQGWGPGTALRALRALEHLDLTWVEEPLLCDDVAAHANLRRSTRVPVAVGENVYTAQQFNQYMTCGAIDYVQADLVRVGGITPYMEIAALARAWGLPMAPHFMMELSGQVLCALPNAFILEDIEGGSLTDLGALRSPPMVVDGQFVPPAAPGHGLVFDEAHMAAHTVHESGV